ncbi:hypothetical protein KSP39_PZI001911 [Platanthera zijinensis]|uniref:Putative plant transposon protein domain-containing protein n=1 Tax=Platanthera zijinensis TaxID=2320716 RepID=A0AAP0GE52_9ASPA
MAPLKKDKGKMSFKKGARFVNDEAQNRYESLKGESVIYERGFQIEVRGWSMKYIEHIREQGWNSFCHPRDEAILSWVYEFYANAPFHQNGKVLVRGKEINCLPEAINNFFHMENLEDQRYEQLRETVSPLEVATTLSMSSDIAWANQAKHVLRSAGFKREAKVWLLFINASVLPTKHPNQVSFSRALLIYCILKGIRINVGRIIAGKLLQRVQSKVGQQLWFPTLITALCCYHGVEKRGEIVTPVGHHITQTVISSNINVSSKRKEPQVQPKLLLPSSTKAAPQSTQQHDNGNPDSTQILEYLKHLTEYQRCHHNVVTAQLKILNRNQQQLLGHAQLPVGDQSLPFLSPFDVDGYMLNACGKRADPSIKDVASDKEISGEDDESDDDMESDESIDDDVDEFCCSRWIKGVGFVQLARS